MIQFKRGKTREWLGKMGTMEKLAPGQPGYDTDRKKMKIGDGKKSWIELPYAGGLNAEEILDSEENAKKRFSAFDKLIAGLGNLLGLDFSNDKVAVITYGDTYPDKDTVGKLYLQHYDAEPEADYIVDHGFDNNWQFQKYSSGIARCWRTFELRTLVTEQLDNIALYHNNTEMTALEYPFTFTETPSETATLRSQGCFAWLVGTDENSKTKSAVYTVACPDRHGTEVKFFITITAEGFWR